MQTVHKTAVAIVALVGLFTAACSKGDAPSPAADQKTYSSTGVIRGIDTKANEVTIDHKDIPGLMSSMVMDFAAIDKAAYEGFAVGDNVEFVLVRTRDKIVLVSMKKVPGSVAAIRGEQIFATNCAECHGPMGEGAKKGIPLISGHALGHSEEEHLKQVEFGKKDKMPAFGDKLTPEQIRAVVTFVRYGLQKAAKRDGDAKHEH